MDELELELERLRELREAYDRSLLVCDPITHAWRNQNLLHALTEYLIRPLQEYEYAEKSKFLQDENPDENPYENIDD